MTAAADIIEAALADGYEVAKVQSWDGSGPDYKNRGEVNALLRYHPKDHRRTPVKATLLQGPTPDPVLTDMPPATVAVGENADGTFVAVYVRVHGWTPRRGYTGAEARKLIAKHGATELGHKATGQHARNAEIERATTERRERNALLDLHFAKIVKLAAQAGFEIGRTRNGEVTLSFDDAERLFTSLNEESETL